LATFLTFLRGTPPTFLKSYFELTAPGLVGTIDWNAQLTKLVSQVRQGVDRLDAVAQATVRRTAERIGSLADEAGQTALYGVIEDAAILDGLPNGYARSVWAFLNHLTEFRHAEEVRYTDDRRGGRMWSGYSGPPGLTLRRDADAIEAFKVTVRERTRSPNVHIDIFDRNRPRFDEGDAEIVQLAVYCEGLPDQHLEFVNGELDRRPRRPVIEAALTYEPASGAIEVVANDRDTREHYVRLFAKQFLTSEFRQEALPLRQYDLSVLRQPHAFPTDVGDGIDTVRVNLLRVVPLDSAGERLTIETTRKATGTVWDMAQLRFREQDPLRGGWIVTQAKLTIGFHPAAGARRGVALPITITLPHGCDLKDRTERERMIGAKYLTRWQIVRDA